MAKKKIKPEDLQLHDEIVSGNLSPNVATTRNTCYPEKPFPEACDTTTTDHTYTGCTTIEEDKCDKSIVLCPSNPCGTSACADSRSLSPICCPLSDGKGDCNTTVCQEYPSVDVCPATDVNCKSVDIVCDKPISEDFDCQVPAD